MTSLTGLKRKIDYFDCPEYTDIMLAIAYTVLSMQILMIMIN